MGHDHLKIRQVVARPLKAARGARDIGSRVRSPARGDVPGPRPPSCACRRAPRAPTTLASALHVRQPQRVPPRGHGAGRFLPRDTLAVSGPEPGRAHPSVSVPGLPDPGLDACRPSCPSSPVSFPPGPRPTGRHTTSWLMAPARPPEWKPRVAGTRGRSLPAAPRPGAEPVPASVLSGRARAEPSHPEPGGQDGTETPPAPTAFLHGCRRAAGDGRVFLDLLKPLGSFYIPVTTQHRA